MDKRVPLGTLAQRILSQASRPDDVAAVKKYLMEQKGMSGDRAYRYIAGYGKSHGFTVEEAAKELRARLPLEK